MNNIYYKVQTPRLRPYSEIRTLLPILEQIPQKLVKSMIAAIAKQAGTPQHPVTWSDPSTWIAERLQGAEAQLAQYIWHESKQTVNPRYIDGARYMIDFYVLLQPDAAGNYVLTAKGQGFLANDRAIMQEIDDSEGILYLLTLLATQKYVKRGNLLSAWGDFLQTYSKFRTTSTILDTLRLRLANVVERGLALRAGQRYQISPAGIAYLHAVESESQRGFHAVESESLSLALHSGDKGGQLPNVEPEASSGSGGWRDGSAPRATHWEQPLDLDTLLGIGEQQCTETELEGWLRDEFQTLIGDAHDAVIWPKEPINVRDRLEIHQIVYLSPAWLDAHPTPEQQAQAQRRYIEECGSSPRQYRNNLTLAIPDARMVQIARQAMRTLFAIEFLESLSAQLPLTEQQQEELSACAVEAENALNTSLTHLYATTYTPTVSHQNGQTYTLEPLPIPSTESASSLHLRLKAALNNQLVWENIQPSTLVSLAQLNEQEEIALQYENLAIIISGFFCNHAWTRVWDANVIRRAVALGVKQRLFGYVTNAYQDSQKHLALSGPATSCVFLGTDLAWQELEVNASTYLVSAAYAQQLLTATDVEAAPAMPVRRRPVTPVQGHRPVTYLPVNWPETLPQLNMPITLAQVSQPVAPAQVRRPATPTQANPPTTPVQPNRPPDITIQSQKSADLYFIQQALGRLEKQAVALHITMHITATSKTGEPVPRDLLHQLVTEPIMEATHAEVIEEH